MAFPIFGDMMTIEKCSEILGVRENSSALEIKKAYREKARVLHPDKNKSPNAHKDFIILTEAYEYLLKYKSGQIAQNNLRDFDYNDQTVRERAEEFARMEYEQFLNSDYYQSLNAVGNIVLTVYYLLAILALFVSPILQTLLFGFKGFLMSLLVIFVCMPLIVSALRDSPRPKLREFLNSINYLSKTNAFIIFIFTFYNVVVIVNVILNTLIKPINYFFILLFIIAVTVLLTKWLLKINKPIFISIFSLCFAPFLINLFFAVNYVFSNTPVQETYHFKKQMEAYGTRYNPDGKQEKTLIILDENKYSDFPGIRAFYNYDQMKSKNYIKYVFEDGFFGLRVMKDYEFH